MGCCSSKKFQGEGQRLGSASENSQKNAPRPQQTVRRDEDIPRPIVNRNLTEEDKQRIREERAAAAEARAKKNQIGKGATKKKKKNTTSTASPLRGPNTQNTMTWTVG